MFPPGLVDDLFTAFGFVLGKLVDDDGWSTVDFGLVGDSAIRGPVVDVPHELVQDGFLRQVSANPDKVAVITPTGELTYGEVHRRAVRVANWLRGRGVRRDHPVAVVLDKGWEQVVAAYGVLLAGVPYLPVDAGAPPARIRSIFERAGVTTALDRFTIEEAIADGLDDPVMVSGEPDDLAYVLFTSGSTGQPKGVMIEHRGMVNAVRATRAEFGVGPSDVCLAVTALHHDMSTFDLFGVLGAGGTVVLPDRDRDAGHWAELIATHGVTLWNSVPAMMEMLLATGTAPGSLRTVFLGGDWVPPTVVRTLRERVPGVEVVSVGGPTETTLWNIWHRVVPSDLDRVSIPYGKPIANTTYYILDERGADKPVGVAGQLCCAGPGVARGYWRDPERTDEVFTQRDGVRIYRTGDLGRMLPDGTIEFVGRADSQVKVRGMRIEPAEIEAALAAVPGVRSAVVVGVPNEAAPGYRAIAAYVTGTVEPEASRAAIRELLPEHMVPATVTVLAEFPLTANGKIDRTALAATGPTRANPAARPSTPLEETIAQTWAEVLGADEVGVHDDFFALGGDSVLATRILADLRSALDSPDLPLIALFGTGTVAGMADALVAAETTPGRLAQVADLYQKILALSDDEVEAELSAPASDRGAR
ncbi:MAG: non-ribosomal peptide synthetase [Actinomycetota bacterium]|nr:non-ribosomal peptide synthetase [Actinomycetota bacterium]